MDRGTWWATVHGVAKGRTQQPLSIDGTEMHNKVSSGRKSVRLVDFTTQ